ncbi:Centromere/kinetochore Zw10-domain-containing protein [Coemansia spiralis]|nr:Centromere/kinetochore Zw10-domain-containing protein [Coemansia spiralis]
MATTTRGLRRYKRENAADGYADFEDRSSEEQLEILETLIEQARASIYEAINSHHRDFLSIRTYGQDPLDEVATLNDKYEVARLRLLEQTTQDDSVSRLDTIGRTIHAIAKLAKTHANLKDVDEQILHGEVAVAASSIAEANTLLRELEANCPMLVSTNQLQILQAQYLKKRAALRAELDYLLAEMYHFTDTSSVCELTVSFYVTANYDGVPYENPVTLSDLFFALTELDLALAREKIDFLTKPLIDCWFIPLLHNPGEALAISRVKLFATMSIGAYSSGKKDMRPGGSEAIRSGLAAQCALVKEKWTNVLMFMCEDMFHEVNIAEDHADLYAYLGTQLWTKLCPLLQECLFVPLVPANIDGISDTHAMLPLLELEETWLELGLISSDTLYIKDSIRSLLQTYVSKRRRDLLTVVASILANDDTNTVIVGGEGPVTDALSDYSGSGKRTNGKKAGKKAAGALGSGALDDYEDDSGSLLFPRCSISVQAQTLVEFARETIGFTEDDDANTIPLYFYAVRDAFVLYRCLLPRQWATELVVDPKRAFVVYNDCEYICHHLSTLGFRQRERHWPDVMKESATFVDAIASYRALAKSSLSPLLNRLREQIQQALGPWLQIKWLESNLDQLDYEDAERKLSLATGIIGQTAQTSDAHLPRAMHLKMLGLLSDTVFGSVANRLEEIGSVGDSDARAIIRLVSPAVALEDRFQYSETTSTNAHGVHSSVAGRGHRRKAPVTKYSKEWENLQAQITRLKGMSAHCISVI